MAYGVRGRFVAENTNRQIGYEHFVCDRYYCILLHVLQIRFVCIWVIVTILCTHILHQVNICIQSILGGIFGITTNVL